MSKFVNGKTVLAGGVALAVLIAGGVGFSTLKGSSVVTPEANAAVPIAIPVSVAMVESRTIVPWEEFSGRLEAIERVEVRSRVAGQIQGIHFREGGLVRKGDLLVTIDPAPFAAEVSRTEAQVTSAQAKLSFTKREYERAQQLAASGNMATRDMESRADSYFEAQAALRAAQADLETARLNLSYTRVTAPVSGRVGKAEVTAGNLVSSGAGAPLLTNLVSVNPIYASFDASETEIMRALASLRDGANGSQDVERIPVQLYTPSQGDKPIEGHVQMIGNIIDAKSGTVGVRAVFDNEDGRLMPGQFAKLQMGHAQSEAALLISDRAVGTDQDKKFVLVVGDDNKAVYRTIVLGPSVDGLRIVLSGLEAGERIIVNGLQRVRPGAVVAPQMTAMVAMTDNTAKR